MNGERVGKDGTMGCTMITVSYLIFGELIRVTVTVTVIIFPVINYITVMSPLQL